MSISFLRKETARSKKHEAMGRPEDAFATQPEDPDEKLARLYQFIDGLGHLDKAIMILYLEEKKHAEIAAITGISPTNVSTRFHRIKQKLSEYFQSEIK